MKRIVYIIALMMLVVMLFTGCDGCSPIVINPSYDGEQYAVDANGNTLMLVKDRKSDYVIVIPENAGSIEKDAGYELQEFLYSSTGIEFKILKDSEITVDSSSKVVLVGDTKYSTSVETTYSALGDSGFIIDLNGNNVILKGATQEGTLYSVYEFLTKEVNFEVYATDEIYIDKASSVKMVNFDNYTVTAAVDWRNPGWAMAMDSNIKRMRMHSPNQSGTSVYGKDYVTSAHSIASFIKPSWYPEHPEWFTAQNDKMFHVCMSKKELINELVNHPVRGLINAIIARPTARFVELGNADDNNCCECTDCKAAAAELGGMGGVYVRWLNWVKEAIDTALAERGIERDLLVNGLAYNAYQLSPVKVNADGSYYVHPDAMAKPGVSMKYCPIGACFAHGLNDPNCTVNSRGKFAEELKKWKYVVGDEPLFIYTYTAEFYDYLFFFNDVGMYNESYKFYEELGVYGVYDTAILTNANGPMIALKLYLRSKLYWNPELDIRTLTDNFYANYFKDAAPFMKEMYDGVRNNFAEISVSLNSGGCYGFNNIGGRYKDPSLWPIDLLFELQESVDKAYLANQNASYSDEVKEDIYWRIKADEILLQHWYVNNYQSSFSQEEYDRIKEDFEYSCAYLGITRYSH